VDTLAISFPRVAETRSPTDGPMCLVPPCSGPWPWESAMAMACSPQLRFGDARRDALLEAFKRGRGEGSWQAGQLRRIHFLSREVGIAAVLASGRRP